MRSLLLHLAVACLTFFVSSQFIRIRPANLPKPLPVEHRQNQPLPEPVTCTGEVNLADIYRDYAAAQTRHDKSFFERVEDEHFTLITSWGSFSRSQDIEDMMSDSPDIIYKTENLKIETKGERAVVTGRMVSTDGDGEVESWEWIDVCVKRDGRWRIMSTTQFN